MPLLILDMGGSAKTIGLFSFLYILPILIIFPFGGVIGDLYNRKKIMVLSDLLSGAVVLILSYLSWIGMLNIVVLLAFQVLVSCFYGVFDPASKGIIPQIVEKNNLSKANSQIASLRILAGMLAPIISVSLYIRFGMTTLFFINGISFILSAISEMFIKYKHKTKNKPIGVKVIVSDLVDGIKFIRKAKIILQLCSFFLVSYAFIHPLLSVVLPLFFRTTLNYSDTYYGYLQMFLFFGAFIGSVVAGYTSSKGKLKQTLIMGILLTSLSVALYTIMLQPSTVVLLGNDTVLYLIIFGLGVFLLYTSMMLVGIPMQTIIQNETPDVYMSRVFSIVSLITKGGAPLGALMYGFVIEKIEVHTSAVTIAILVAVICMKYILSFRKITSNDQTEVV